MPNTTFNTRISLKYDTFANWTQNNPVLLSGEVAVVVIPANAEAVAQEPAILFKVGDGSSRFNSLQFVSGLAADVYDWAKAATKPSYSASEIDGLADYISDEVQDTNTTYKIEMSENNPRKYILYRKNIGDSAFTEQDTITIPAETVYTLAEGSTNGTVKFNNTDVAVHGLKSAAYKEASDFTISCNSSTNVNGVAKRYTIKQGSGENAPTVATIDIPKDMVVSSGEVVTLADGEVAGKDAGTYIKLTLANSTGDPLYIPANSLVDVYTSGSAADAPVVISVDNNRKITATLTDGKITLAKLESSVQTAIGKAHEHSNKTVLDGISANKVTEWDGKAAGNHGHNIESLGQSDDTYIIFNCGSSSVNI